MKKVLLALVAVASLAMAKPSFKVSVDRASAVYKCGETVTFTVTAADDEGKPLPSAAKVRLSNDGGKQLREESADFSAKATLKFSATMDKPSFLKCVVSCQYDNAEGKKATAHAQAGAAFDPEKIAPARPEPKDFMDYWKGEIAKADKNIPLDPQLTKFDKFSNEKHTSYKVSFAAPGGRVYGYLCVPSKPGKKPAIVSVPGAGPGVKVPIVSDEFVTLNMNVHPYELQDEGKLYIDQYAALNKSGVYMYHGGADREKTFFHRPIVGIARAVEWLAKRDDVYATRIGYHGSSQGGAFGLILGGLTQRFAAIVCNVPAMCDHYGAEAGRLPGWPFFIVNLRKNAAAEAIDGMVPYYDAANFARHINAPIRVIVGFIDTTCCPSSVYSAFNVLKSKDKKMIHEIETGHAVKPSFYEGQKWMMEVIRGNAKADAKEGAKNEAKK